MEITLKNIKFGKKENIALTIPHQEVTAITGPGSTKFISTLINNINTPSCELTINKQNQTNLEYLKKNLSIVKEELNLIPSCNTIGEYMLNLFCTEKLQIKNPTKKIIDSLKIMGLPPYYTKRVIQTLSSSEQKLFQLAVALLRNPKLIILEEPFTNLDSKNIKRIIRLLNQLNDKYNITIIIKTTNTEIIYKYIKHTIIFTKDKILLQGPTKEIYSQVEVLTKNKIEIPQIVNFVYKAKTEKQVLIDYHRDIRDLIKDIYKHI